MRRRWSSSHLRVGAAGVGRPDIAADLLDAAYLLSCRKSRGIALDVASHIQYCAVASFVMLLSPIRLGNGRESKGITVGRVARAIVSAIIAVSIIPASACGGSDDAAPSTPPAGTVTATITRAGASEAEKIAVTRLCKQVITTAGVMVRDYNAFIKRLNQVQSYDKIGSEDKWAADTLTSGADEVRKMVAPDVPEDIDAEVQDFVTSSERLAEQIEGQRRLALNSASEKWSSDRERLLATCSEYLPAGSD